MCTNYYDSVILTKHIIQHAVICCHAHSQQHNTQVHLSEIAVIIMKTNIGIDIANPHPHKGLL